jgi:uncharacterized protein (TIGR03086 family)
MEADVSEVSERYARLAAAFADKIAAVPGDAWDNPSPCPDWTARDVVGHVVSTQGMFLGFVNRELGAIPSVDDDPLAAWKAASTVVQADLEDPERAAAEFEGFTGKSTFEAAVNRFLCFDLVVHAWDLARAAGLDHRMEPEDIARVRRQAEEFGDAMRGPQAFGPEVEAPESAGDQEKLLAFLGRTP